MELELSVYDWLAEASVLSEYEVRERNEHRVILDKDATLLFEIGLKLPPLLLRLQSIKAFCGGNSLEPT